MVYSLEQERVEYMKRDTLKKKGILVGLIITIFGVSIFITTQPKEQLSQSAPIAEQENIITLNTIAMYQENDSGTYDEITTMPTSGYTINEEESYCTIDGTNRDNNARVYTNESGEHVISNLQKNEKCYLYFDKDSGSLLSDAILEGKSVQTRSDFSTVLTDDTTGIIYQTSDNDGTSYYFAGDTEENWVRFGGYYWRIIRINGDGSVRMIYAGEDSGSVTDANRVGSTTQIGQNLFNLETDRGEYVGFKYTLNEQHGSTTNSDILDMINTWYITNISSLDQAKVDTSAWFCSDRVSYSDRNGSTSSWVSTGSTIYYAAYVRLITNKEPTLQCSNANDRLVTSNGVGLITADEVAMAGGVYNTINQSYYIYTGQYYWTLSPRFFSSYAVMFLVTSSGQLSPTTNNSLNSNFGVRPVINLKADVKLTGDGTASNPFVVEN